jgi:hypothetical protein
MTINERIANFGELGGIVNETNITVPYKNDKQFFRIINRLKKKVPKGYRLRYFGRAKNRKAIFQKLGKRWNPMTMMANDLNLVDREHCYAFGIYLRKKWVHSLAQPGFDRFAE